MNYNLKASDLSLLLKSLKFGKYLDLGLYRHHLKITNLDNKGFTGMVTLIYPCPDQDHTHPLYFNIDSGVLCKALDRYGLEQIMIQPDPTQDCLNLSSPSSTKKYKVPCSFNTKSKDLVELSPLDRESLPQAQVKITPSGFQELLKDLQAVDTKVQLRLIKEDSRSTLVLDSSGAESLFTERVSTQNSTIDSIMIKDHDLLERRLVVPTTLGGLVKIMEEPISLLFYQEYLVIESRTPGYVINVLIPFQD